MAKTIHKEKQRPQRWGIITLLALLSGLTLNRVTTLLLSGEWVYTDLFISAALLLGLSLCWYLFYKAQLSIKVTDRCLKISANRLLKEQYKLRFADVADYEFVDMPILNRWNGSLVNFDSQLRNFDFGDRHGLFLRMKDGRQFLIFSDGLYEQRNELQRLLAA